MMNFQQFVAAVDGIVGLEKGIVEQSYRDEGLDDVPLYHYTTAAGLVGIVDSQSIFASDAACLNDREELRYVDKVLEQVGASLQVHTEAGERFKEQVSSGTIRIKLRGGAFVASFSEDPDSLSQWRAYADDGAGYVVGLPDHRHLFVVDDISRHAWPAPLMHVAYDLKDQKSLLYAPIQGIAAQLDDFAKCATSQEVPNAITLAVSRAAMAAEHRAPMIKNPGFREEREWRAVVRFMTVMYPGHKLHFRPSAHGLTSHLKLASAFDEDGRPRLTITQVVTGPKLDRDVAVRTAKYLLKQRDYRVSGESSRPESAPKSDEQLRVWHSSTSYR